VADTRLRQAMREWESERSPQAATAIVASWMRGLVGQPEADVFVAAWFASGGRDPRKDPLVGDKVEAAKPLHGGKHYKPRQWTIVHPKWPVTGSDPYNETWPASCRLIRRARTGAENQLVQETVLLRSWREGMKHGTVLKVACKDCCGVGHTSQFAEPPCRACLGTGHSIHGVNASAEAPFSSKRAPALA
jgi:hypothetical protein